MTETQFLALLAALAASFAWIVGMRDKPRIVRVLGVAVMIGAWVAYRAILRA
jgi:hypothetical protein